MDNATVGATHRLFTLDAEQVACPYPTFRTMRETAAVEWYDELEAFAVTDYGLILEVLRQPEAFSSRSTTGPAADREVVQMMIELASEDPEFGHVATKVMEGTSPVLLSADPPEHPRQRALVNRSFTPAAIRRMEPGMLTLANRLVDDFTELGEVELMTEFAVPFPMTVIATALGISLDHMDDFMRWSRTIVAGIGKRAIEKSDLVSIVRTRAELGEYLLSVVLEHEKSHATT